VVNALNVNFSVDKNHLFHERENAPFLILDFIPNRNHPYRLLQMNRRFHLHVHACDRHGHLVLCGYHHAYPLHHGGVHHHFP